MDTASVGIKATDIVSMEMPGRGWIPGFVEMVATDGNGQVLYRVRTAFSGKVFRRTEDTLRTMSRAEASKVRRDMTCFGRGSRMKVIALHLSEAFQTVTQIHARLEADGWGWSKDTVRRTLDAMVERASVCSEMREVAGRPTAHYWLKGSTR